MTLEIISCEQNSTDWRLARLGIATASCFDAIMTPGKTKTEQKTRRTYLLKLAGEIVTGEPMEHVMTRDMERGHLLEPEARDLYTLQTSAELHRVGFVKNGRAGCSPDSLIGEDGGLEIKTKAPHLLIDVILRDEFPEDHKAQVQGALWITGRKWWDIAVYWPGLPLFVKRAFRDEAYIETLSTEVARFNTDLDMVVTDMQARVALDPFALPETPSLAEVSEPVLAALQASVALKATPIFANAPIDTTTIAPNGIPAFLDRTGSAERTIDEPKWLADITKDFEKCITVADLVERGVLQLMEQAKSKVSPPTWAKAAKLMQRAMTRLTAQPSAELATAAE